MKSKHNLFVVLGIAVFGLGFSAPGLAAVEDDFMFKNLSSELCLDGHGRGKDAKVSKCRTAFSAARWSFNVETGQIMHAKRNLCLAVSNSNKANGARVVMWPCSSSANQRWKLPTIANTDGPIVSALHGKCLDVSKVNLTSNTANLHMWDCHQGKNQVWHLLKINRSFKTKKKNRYFSDK